MIERRADRMMRQAETAFHASEDSTKRANLATNYFNAKSILDKLGKKSPKKSLDTSLVTVSIAGLLGGIFFLSSNITGNVIGNITNSTTNFLGAGPQKVFTLVSCIFNL